jgi:hypothetical protein
MRIARLMVLVAALAAIAVPSALALTFNDENFPLPEGVVGQPYNYTLKARGGCPPYNMKLLAGSLPAGITLASEGLLSGTPTAAGTSTFWVWLSDLGCGSFPSEFEMSMTIKSRVLVTTESLSAATSGVPYSVTLTAEGPTPLTWTVLQGAIPDGLTLTPEGVLSGTPTTVAPASFVVKATHADGRSDTKSLTLNVLAPLVVTPPTVPSAEVDRPFSLAPAATGGMTPYTWALAEGSVLPTGLAITDGATGVISGTPTAAGTFPVTLNLTDANGSKLAVPITLVVAGKLGIRTLSLPQKKVGLQYTATLRSSGGVTPIKWRLAKGKLPRGLRLNATTGVISGTSKEAGTFPITLAASDALKAAARSEYELSITAPKLVIKTRRLPDAKAGRAYRARLEAIGGYGERRWRVVEGSLPSGFRLDRVTGVLSGTTRKVGVFGIVVEVKDSLGATTPATLEVVVDPAE